MEKNIEKKNCFGDKLSKFIDPNHLDPALFGKRVDLSKFPEFNDTRWFNRDHDLSRIIERVLQNDILHL